MELRLDAILYTNLGNENSDAGHIIFMRAAASLLPWLSVWTSVAGRSRWVCFFWSGVSSCKKWRFAWRQPFLAACFENSLNSPWNFLIARIPLKEKSHSDASVTLGTSCTVQIYCFAAQRRNARSATMRLGTLLREKSTCRLDTVRIDLVCSAWVNRNKELLCC